MSQNIIIIVSERQQSYGLSEPLLKKKGRNNMLHMELMPDHSEMIPYDCKDIPLYIRTADLSEYPGMSAPCHWHDDLEWIHILKGTMYYDINGERLLLHENESLMVNARQMHYGYSNQKQDCRFFCILFHPSLFCGNHSLLQKYMNPVMKNSSPQYLYFPSGHSQAAEISKYLTGIVRLKEKSFDGYELEAAALMQILWSRLWRNEQFKQLPDNPKVQTDLNIQKDMVSFIYERYSEKITLDDIAAAGNVSRSKCCRIFKHFVQQSPIDFLNTCRLKISCQLLETTDKSITEIAFACGFNHLSYFSKYFYQVYHCTPREYRKQTTQ